MSVSVIVPHYDDLANLKRCMMALAAQTSPAHEVIVADNGSPCGLAAVAAAAAPLGAKVKVIEVRERGAGPARNAGVAASSGELLAFLDGDVRPAPDWLRRGGDALAQAPIVGGRVDVEPGDAAQPSAMETWDVLFGFDAEKGLRRNRHLLTGNMFVRREVFEAVGGFRNGVPEDLDWSRRALAAGYELTYDAEIVVVHPAMAEWDGLARRWRRLTTEQYHWAAERRLGRFAFWIRSFVVLASIAPHGLRVLASRRVKVADKAAMLAILARVRLLRFAEAQRLTLAGGRLRAAGGQA